MKKRKLLLSLPLILSLPIISISCSEPWDKNKHTELENFERFVEEFPKELKYDYLTPAEFTPAPTPRELTETEKFFYYKNNDFKDIVKNLVRKKYSNLWPVPITEWKYHYDKRKNLDYTKIISSPALLGFSHEESYFRKVYDSWNYLPENGILDDKKYSIGFIVMSEYQGWFGMKEMLKNAFYNKKHEHPFSKFLNYSDYEKNEINFKEWTKFIKLEDFNREGSPIPSEKTDKISKETTYKLKNLLINIRFGYKDENGIIRSKKDYLKYVDLTYHTYS
ncbi:hypothetical protein [Metamycoplasma auris]|uniref:Lipoprotein n=1 Tax=Metamycoplasma auris TaxID=51363 RepID=A0A2W7FWQ3_9BACT|nr:hypothetical protein [Metamycoplasma auris]PZV98711.1 hypothetical protein BCF89_1134 [Metamycoplasma auris]